MDHQEYQYLNLIKDILENGSFEKTRNHFQNKDFIFKKLEKNNVDWIPLKYTKYPPIFSTLWDVYKLSKAVNKLKNKGLDLIHCRSFIFGL